MKGVPPEIDALMWRLAEEGGPSAQAEFEARHGRYAPELARRIKMVAELREAGKAVSHRPTFSPRPVRKTPPPRWVVGGTVGLAVLAVGAVAYVVASPEPSPSKPPVVIVPQIDSRPPVRTPEVAPVPPQEAPPKQEASPKTEPSPPIGDEAAPVRADDSGMTRDVRMESTSLTAAITLVAASGGLKVTLAPGFQDQTVSLDYRGLNALDTLKEMGVKYGFTVFEQEEGRLLIIPAREATSDRRIGP